MSVFAVVALGCGGGDGWVRARDDEAGISATFPGEPLRTTDTIETPAGPLPMRTMAWPGPGTTKNGVRFEITTSSFPLDTVDEAIRVRVLDGARDGILATTGGRLLDEGPVEVDAVRGRRTIVAAEQGAVTLTAHLFLHDRHMVQALAFAEDETAAPELVDRFCRSLRFESLRQEEGP